MLTGTQLAALIIAVFWAVLVCVLAFVLVKLARLLGETTKLVSELGTRVGPLLDDVSLTVDRANEQLVRVDAITTDVQQVAGDAAVLSGAARGTLATPLVKVVALASGVRRALRARRAITAAGAKGGGTGSGGSRPRATRSRAAGLRAASPRAASPRAAGRGRR